MPSALPTNSLRPGFVDRFSERLRSDRVRAVHVRRIIAAALAVSAVFVMLRGNPDDDRVKVVVAAHDLRPGVVLTDQDLEVTERDAGSIPAGSQMGTDTVTGRILAGPTRAGEPLTDIRILGPRLAEAATGIPDARIVPLRLADPGVAGLLREGDLVDVLTVAPEKTAGAADTATAATLATGAVVVLVTQPENDRNQRERVVMLALPRGDATRVGAASLTDAITVTLQ